MRSKIKCYRWADHTWAGLKTGCLSDEQTQANTGGIHAVSLQVNNSEHQVGKISHNVYLTEAQVSL